MFSDQFESLASVSSFGHDLYPFHLFQKRSNTRTDQGMVIGQQNAGRLHKFKSSSFGRDRNGKNAWISVPPPSIDLQSNSPPTRATRSRIPSSPKLAPCWAVAASKPIPSSPTTSWRTSR